MRLRIKYCICMAAILILSTFFTGCHSSSNTGNNSATNAVPPTSNEYDNVLASGGGYHIVMKRVDEFSGAYDMVGVVNDAGEWIHELSKDHPFIKDGQIMKGQTSIMTTLDGKKVDSRIYDIKNSLRYVGESMFAMHYATNGNSENSYIMFNAETGLGFDAGICEGIGEFHNGYMIVAGNRKVDTAIKIISRDGVVSEPGISTEGGNWGIFSEEVFFAGNRFYYVDGTVAIDLFAYPAEKIVNAPAFENNKCYLEIKNDAGTVYYTEIDHNGNFLYEPVKK